MDKPTIKTENNVQSIFCVVRKKWIILTPEESVRQYTLQQLVHQHQYPLKYISVEKSFKVNKLVKRYDIVVYNQSLQPKILIECKAETIPIDYKTLQQIATYNLHLKVPYLMVTNGKNSYYFLIENDTSTAIDTLPLYNEL